MFLTEKDYSQVIRFVPVTTIDLCVINKKKILLGRRNNPPAKDYFFVPGGRIYKNETLDKAFDRIIKDELGSKTNKFVNKKFLGTYQHFYKDNFLGTEEFDSHYIVLAFIVLFEEFIFEDDEKINQHSEFVWFNKKVDKSNKIENKIHPYVKDYLKHPSLISFMQH